jgi:hypothetical protein
LLLFGTIPSLQSIPAGPANEVIIFTFKAFYVHCSLFQLINQTVEVILLLNANSPIQSLLLGCGSDGSLHEDEEKQLECIECGLWGHLEGGMERERD